jgi:hypothetical protein
MAEVAPTLRERPPSFTDPYGPPEQPVFVRFYHPANGLAFLTLPAYDVLSRSPLKFGIHYQTALTACCILACNKSGYLSTSRDGSGRVDDDLDAIIPISKYFYHLDNPGSDALYPLCRDFATWKFPHNCLPISWQPAAPTLPSIFTVNWSVQSQRIKERDHACLVTGWKDSLTTAHVVGAAEEDWVRSICGSS